MARYVQRDRNERISEAGLVKAGTAAQQSLAADGAIARFPSSLVPSA
jgi:hypothetical protein